MAHPQRCVEDEDTASGVICPLKRHRICVGGTKDEVYERRRPTRCHSSRLLRVFEAQEKTPASVRLPLTQSSPDRGVLPDGCNETNSTPAPPTPSTGTESTTTHVPSSGA